MNEKFQITIHSNSELTGLQRITGILNRSRAKLIDLKFTASSGDVATATLLIETKKDTADRIESQIRKVIEVSSIEMRQL